MSEAAEFLRPVSGMLIGYGIMIVVMLAVLLKK